MSSGLCVKWFNHSVGDPCGQEKPISSGRSISILVSDNSDFQIDFSADAQFPIGRTLTYRLQRKGDFAIWGANVFHRAFGHRAATIMTIRWEISTA
jgi:hypothetical protein